MQHLAGNASLFDVCEVYRRRRSLSKSVVCQRLLSFNRCVPSAQVYMGRVWWEVGNRIVRGVVVVACGPLKVKLVEGSRA